MAREDEKQLNLKGMWVPLEDHRLLQEIKDSGKTAHDSFASIVRLYIRMGLELHRRGIDSVDDLRRLFDQVERSKDMLTEHEIRIKRLEQLLNKGPDPRTPN